MLLEGLFRAHEYVWLIDHSRHQTFPRRPSTVPVAEFALLNRWRIIETTAVAFAAIISLNKTLMPAILQSPPPTFELKPYKSLSNDELTARIQAVRQQLGPQLVILGHHYQQDEVIALSDWRGDSYGLSQHAAASSECRYIVFCGVHFMAETADILANRPEKLAERNGE